MKLNLHLFSDEKFVEGAILQFEKYYPEKNIYIINTDKEHKYIIPSAVSSFVFFSCFRKKSSADQILAISRQYGVKNVFIHYLDYLKAGIVLKLAKSLNFKTFWIFYGADFYSQITDRFNFFDSVQPHSSKKSSNLKSRMVSLKYLWRHGMTGKQAIQKVINDLNYFCFWNENELLNVKKYFECKAEFRWFIYTAAINFEEETLPHEKDKNILLINHSASRWSNHFTILDTLMANNAQNLFQEILIPLNYGEDWVREGVIEYCDRKGMINIHLLTSFLPPNIYFERLKSVSVAAFGAKRQEGAGNIFFLLRNGTKIYLREENPLLIFLRDSGFIVFSVENQMNTKESFNPLSMEDRLHNKKAYESIFNPDHICLEMKKLLA